MGLLPGTMVAQRGKPMAAENALCFSSDARQRDLLPLPHMGEPSEWTSLSHLGRGTRQRVSQRQAMQARCNSACDAVNSLSCGVRFKPQTGPPSEAQLASHLVLQAAVEEYPPPADLVRPDEALRLLLHSGGKYDGVDATGSLAPYGSGELSLPSDAKTAPGLVSMLDAVDSQTFVGFREHLLLPEADYQNLVQTEGLAGLYFEPVLKHHRRKYIALLEQMH